MIPQKPLITIGIPTFNGSLFIKEAIESVLCQTYDNIELLIMDNFSDDNTGEIVEEFIKTDSRVRYIKQETNIGYVRNFNSIKQYAKGGYILFFADDDLYAKDYVEILWKSFVENPQATLSIGSVKRINMQGEEIGYNNNFTAAKIESSIHLQPVDRICKVIRYGHNREWSWPIILGLHKKDALVKHPFTDKIMDPGTLFYRSIIFEGDFIFNPDAIFYKRIGGLSAPGVNYDRPVNVKTKFADIRNAWLQLYYEFKAIITSKFNFTDKRKLILTFFRYRFSTLFKHFILFIASFFSFLFVKGPIQFLKSRFSK